MFRLESPQTRTRTAFGLLELIFHATVRQVRKGQGNAVLGLLKNIFQTGLMILIFYFMMVLVGMRAAAIRGDFILYLMSGVLMFMTHTKTVSAVMGAEGPTSQMMKHSPMNTVVSIIAAALGSLYLQLLSTGTVLYLYHVIFTPVTIQYPIASLGMVFLAWGSGVGIGMLFLAAKPWAPGVVGIISVVYQRANMIASGKMFVANAMPTYILNLFDWNPLFHIIDQARGFIFLNYNPHYSNVSYPIYVALACVMIGLMAEFFTRQHASVSWGARQ
jgi:ABC-type polysaccharide/polyol phosphate export permease